MNRKRLVEIIEEGLRESQAIAEFHAPETARKIEALIFDEAKVTCSTCRYWVTQPVHQYHVTECRRHAPEVGHGQSLTCDDKRMFPKTSHDDWCGEYEAKPRS